MIRTQGLAKRYGRTTAVDGIDLEVPEGSVYGLLGPNAAGKTTSLKMLLNIVIPTAGAGTVLGLDIVRDSVAVRQQTAYVADDKSVYAGMRCQEFLRYYLSFFPGARLEDALVYLQRWRIDPRQRTQALSRGSRLKVLLAGVFARHARVTLLDEPTEGLDPAAVDEVLGELVERSAGMGTVLLATHRLEEVERICDRVGIIQEGRLVLQGDLDELRSTWKRIVLRDDAVADAPFPTVVREERTHGSRVFTTSSFGPAHEQFLAEAPGRAVEVRDMNLREIYLAVTGTPAAEAS